MAKTMTARFAGSCKACGGRIAAGSQITWSRAAGAKHSSCDGAGETDYTFRPCWQGGRCEDAPCCGCEESQPRYFAGSYY